jgi:hypothetical protein
MKQKPIKCQIKGCRERACAWINEKFVCKRHFYIIKDTKPNKREGWLDKYIKENGANKKNNTN